MTLPRPRIAIPEPTSVNPVYNAGSWPQYAHAVESAGGEAVIVELSESQSRLATLVRSCAGILLPGSPADVDPEKYGRRPSLECNPKDPRRESADDLLLQDAYSLQKPILGICYGLQSLNVWRNGTLVQDIAAEGVASDAGGLPRVNHKPGREIRDAHAVALATGSRLCRILEPASELKGNAGAPQLSVNSSHHQAVREPGDLLNVVARSLEDGIIEALEGRRSEHFVLGVQWHPERTYESSAASRAIFEALVAAARVWRPRAIHESVAE